MATVIFLFVYLLPGQFSPVRLGALRPWLLAVPPSLTPP